MRNVIKLFSISLVISVVGATTVKGQTPRGGGINGETFIDYHENGFQFQTIPDPCTPTYMSTNRMGFYFEKPIVGGSIVFNTMSDDGFCWTQPNGNIEFKVNWDTKLFISGSNGRIGVNTTNPQRQFDVNGEIGAKGMIALNEGHLFSLYFGRADNQNLNWGTSYVGFNAIRNPSTGSWKFEGDGANNGGSVIWTTVGGDMYFASIPSTGANFKTLTDAQIRQNVKLMLKSNGELQAKEVLVAATGWPDYVFENNYSLKSLQETEAFIKENKHLPEIPSAKEVEENGINLGDMQAKLLLKVEELTLYIIELQKQIDELKQTKKGGE